MVSVSSRLWTPVWLPCVQLATDASVVTVQSVPHSIWLLHSRLQIPVWSLYTVGCECHCGCIQLFTDASVVNMYPVCSRCQCACCIQSVVNAPVVTVYTVGNRCQCACCTQLRVPPWFAPSWLVVTLALLSLPSSMPRAARPAGLHALRTRVDVLGSADTKRFSVQMQLTEARP